MSHVVCVTGASAAVTQYNGPRRCISRYFPSRKCFTFPVPIDDHALMPQLVTLSEDRFVPQFLQRSKEFCDYVFSHSEPKAVGANLVDGQSGLYFFCFYRIVYVNEAMCVQFIRRFMLIRPCVYNLSNCLS